MNKTTEALAIEALEIVAGERMCIDNLLSDKDIARQTLTAIRAARAHKPTDCPCCGAKGTVIPSAFCRECKSDFWPPSVAYFQADKKLREIQFFSNALLETMEAEYICGSRELEHKKINLRNALFSVGTRPKVRPNEHDSAAWRCACGANLYIDSEGNPASKAITQPIQSGHIAKPKIMEGFDRSKYTPEQWEWCVKYENRTGFDPMMEDFEAGIKTFYEAAQHACAWYDDHTGDAHNAVTRNIPGDPIEG